MSFRPSRGFLASLLGVAMTLLAWYGPWEWPAFPAFTVIKYGFGSQSSFGELPYAQRSAAIVGLIAVNVAAWGGAASLISLALSPKKVKRNRTLA